MKHLRLTAWLIAGWIVTGYIYVMIRYMGHYGVTTNPLDSRVPVNFWLFFMIATLGGIIIGPLHAALELFFDARRFRGFSYGRLFAIKGVTFFFLVALIFAGATIWDYRVVTGTFDFDKWLDLFINPRVLIPLLYMSGVAFVLSFLRQISLKFGPGNLRKMLAGKFHHPREEERIFMFMDMKDSTSIAERLGHVRFGSLIQDCFHDLPVVARNKAEIYQYVGDEVVLSWSLDAGLAGNNCIHAYFNYVDRLTEHKQYYLDRYQLLPEFKAGVNIGKVTVAEIGTIRKDIAYLGDTVNTASRIQALSSDLRKPLLISQSLAERLQQDPTLRIETLGHFALRGKEGEVGICSVERLAL